VAPWPVGGGGGGGGAPPLVRRWPAATAGQRWRRGRGSLLLRSEVEWARDGGCCSPSWSSPASTAGATAAAVAAPATGSGALAAGSGLHWAGFGAPAVVVTTGAGVRLGTGGGFVKEVDRLLGGSAGRRLRRLGGNPTVAVWFLRRCRGGVAGRGGGRRAVPWWCCRHCRARWRPHFPVGACRRVCPCGRRGQRRGSLPLCSPSPSSRWWPFCGGGWVSCRRWGAALLCRSSPHDPGCRRGAVAARTEASASSGVLVWGLAPDPGSSGHGTVPKVDVHGGGRLVLRHVVRSAGVLAQLCGCLRGRRVDPLGVASAGGLAATSLVPGRDPAS